MSNLPPGDNSGAEPRLHWTGCALWCDYDLSDWPADSNEASPCGHADHECNCDDLAWADAENDADALWDFGDWQR